MQDRVEFTKNSMKILSNLYKEKIEITYDKYYIVKYNNKTDEIKTKYELKKYMRDIISSNNKKIHDDIQSIIRLKYQLNKSELLTLKELYPNIDLFISTYIRIINAGIKIKLETFSYEELLNYLIETYINYMRDKQNKEAFVHMSLEEKKLNEEIKELEEKLNHFLIVKKYSFYYETYLKSIEYENETYNEGKEILELNLKNIDKEINTKEKELKKLENKKISIHRREKIESCNQIINNLIDEKEKNVDELQKLEIKDKQHSSKNKDSFKEYVKDIDLKTYEEYYNKYKNINAQKILDDILEKKEKLNKKIEEIAESQYPEIHLILKHYCLDALKTLDQKSDISPKIIKNISKLLEDNKK